MKKKASTRKQRENWFKGELLLKRAMLHLSQHFNLETPRNQVAAVFAWEFCDRALEMIRVERRLFR